MLKAAEHSKIGKLLDVVLSIEEVGLYKTHPDVY
jgi:FMN phosphatase YigB (HAD superfamily)